MKRTMWAGVGLVGLLMAVPALGQGCPCGCGPGAGFHGGHGGGPHGGPGRGMMGACLASPEVGLNEQQKARLGALREEGRKEAAAHRHQIQRLRREVHQAMLDPGTSRAEIEARFEALHRAQDEARRAMEARLLEARAVLTRDQLSRMAGLPECQGPWWGPVDPNGPGPDPDAN